MPNRFEDTGAEAGGAVPEGAPAEASAGTAPQRQAPTSVSAASGATMKGRAATSTRVRAGWSAWRCASLASLALAGCVVANVAGCGGGGGGGSVVPSPQFATAIVSLVTATGQGTNGTVTLNGVTKTTTNTRATFTNLRPGTYPLRFTVAGVTTSTSIAVSSQSTQTFLAIPGLSNVSSNGIRVTGRTLLNTPSDSTVAACSTTSQPVTAALVIQVRSLNAEGRPVVSSLIRPANTDGRYLVFTIPSPGTYRVEARSLDSSAAAFAGTSASFTINAGQTQANLDICTNQSANAPGGTPPPPPGTPTAGPGTGTPNATLTANPNATFTPGVVIGTATPTGTLPAGTPTATANGTPTATANGTAGATSTAGGVPTSTGAPTPTNSPTPTTVPTTGAGTPTATPSPTPTAIGQVTPPSTP